MSKEIDGGGGVIIFPFPRGNNAVVSGCSPEILKHPHGHRTAGPPFNELFPVSLLFCGQFNAPSGLHQYFMTGSSVSFLIMPSTSLHVYITANSFTSFNSSFWVYSSYSIIIDHLSVERRSIERIKASPQLLTNLYKRPAWKLLNNQ